MNDLLDFSSSLWLSLYRKSLRNLSLGYVIAVIVCAFVSLTLFLWFNTEVDRNFPALIYFIICLPCVLCLRQLHLQAWWVPVGLMVKSFWSSTRLTVDRPSLMIWLSLIPISMILQICQVNIKFNCWFTIHSSTKWCL